MCVCVAVARCSLKNISNDVERCLSLVRYYILGSFFFGVVCSLVFFFFFFDMLCSLVFLCNSIFSVLKKDCVDL